MPKVALAVLGILTIIIILLAVLLIANFRFNQSVKEKLRSFSKIILLIRLKSSGKLI